MSFIINTPKIKLRTNKCSIIYNYNYYAVSAVDNGYNSQQQQQRHARQQHHLYNSSLFNKVLSLVFKTYVQFSFSNTTFERTCMRL